MIRDSISSIWSKLNIASNGIVIVMMIDENTNNFRYTFFRVYIGKNFICENENINYNNEIIDMISDSSKGDLRTAINMLELYYRNNINNINNKIDKNFIFYLSGRIPDNLYLSLFTSVKNKNFKKCLAYINYIYKEGYSIVNQINIILDYILNFDISDDKKFLLIKKLSEIDQNIIEENDEYLQFLNLFIYIYSMF
jgi:DNA polymerase III delta prime subunit